MNLGAGGGSPRNGRGARADAASATNAATAAGPAATGARRQWLACRRCAIGWAVYLAVAVVVVLATGGVY